MQWFKIPPKIYFENGSVQYLEKMPHISRAFIVTDPMMVKLGYVDKVIYYLRKRAFLYPNVGKKLSLWQFQQPQELALRLLHFLLLQTRQMETLNIL